MAQPNKTTLKIQTLNDRFRETLVGGDIVMTQGFLDYSPTEQNEILDLVSKFNNFSEDNDPHGDHDFGSFEYKGEKFFWKIDYYDLKKEYASPDASDPKQTTRVMTVMLADEY